MMSKANEFPFRDTHAARMLSAGLQRAIAQRGVSLRQLGASLGYKQAVVLSHMASGRVPIPIDRTNDLAGILEMDRQSFLAAVLSQRHPGVDWSILTSGAAGLHQTALASELTDGRPAEELAPGQRQVIREAAADSRADQRWLTPHEVPALRLLRDLRPAMVTHGLAHRDLDAIRGALRSRTPKVSTS